MLAMMLLYMAPTAGPNKAKTTMITITAKIKIMAYSTNP